MAYEALYRRYRPSTFADVAGQSHVVSALRNAVEGDRVGHAYLFSGPRGTGKTTSARILAKALNCTNLQGGEPCDTCDSCLSFHSGGSYDLHELDAASNNGVDAMRDLIGKVALGSPGRTKVYILDEVHMLSSGAENALLKTLEEPPPHVVFVLCTTEPNKVVPTIRSRTQHLEFSLLSADEIGGLIDYVAGDAGLEITPEDRSYVMRAGGGSARDTLSALDQVVAAGGAPQGGEHLEALFQALIDRDGAAALASVDGALQAGRDAASIATALLHELRSLFLATMRADLSHVPEAERELAQARAAAMSPARVTRAVEVIGTSIIEMRQAPDPRVDLEVAIVRLTRPDLDTDTAALLERIEALEAHLAGGPPIAPPVATAPASAAAAAPAPAPAPAPVEEAPTAPPSAPPAEPVAAEQPATPPAAPPHQAPPQSPPAQAPAPAAGGGGGGSRRGADIVRAALAEQGIAGSQPPQPAPQASAPPAAAANEDPQQAPAQAPPSGGKTLADVRRERQAAAAAQGQQPDHAAVDEAAAGRRERQAAAQAANEAATAQQVAPQPVAPEQQAPAPEQVPPEQVPPQQVAPTQQVVPEQQAPAPEQVPAQQIEPEQPAAAPQPTSPPEAAPAPAATPAPAPSAAGGAPPSKDELIAAWPDLLAGMSGRVRSRFSAGHFLDSTPASANFGLPNPVHRDRCEEIRAEVDQALAAKFGRPVALALVVDMAEPEPDFFATPPSGGAGAVDETEAMYEEESVDVHALVDATGDIPSAEDRVMATFEGSTLIEDPPNPHADR